MFDRLGLRLEMTGAANELITQSESSSVTLPVSVRKAATSGCDFILKLIMSFLNQFWWSYKV